VAWWHAIASDPGAHYDDRVEIDGTAIAPSVTWGINPGQNVGVDESIPTLTQTPDDERASVAEALEYMDLRPGTPIAGTPVDVAFIGSCTNGRIEDLRIAAKVLKGRKVAPKTRCLIVPATTKVWRQAMDEGLFAVFQDAGCAISTPTCGACLGGYMGILAEGERCISTTNRNFVGRMGHPRSEVYLANPATVAASAIEGVIADPRAFL
ncbi:MAG: 3-isopropylmalate dehydratase large subunit, partial [Candidatus Latescibacteria bacterium]|nr:3-isopropylmalate dehydratase large subunit [Candidatus Latescibacterota bacterium]